MAWLMHNLSGDLGRGCYGTLVTTVHSDYVGFSLGFRDFAPKAKAKWKSTRKMKWTPGFCRGIWGEGLYEV